MLEYLKEEIKELRDKVSFLRNMLLALFSAIGGIIFGISQDKILINLMLEILIFVNILLIILFSLRIVYLENEKKKILKKLKEVK
jgi:hypothetical protein